MNTTLTSRKCVPCEGNVKAFTKEQIALYIPQVKEWKLIEDKKLQREFSCTNFMEAVAFVNTISALAEEEGHHPDMNLHDWNKVTVTVWTHAIQGLFLNDFILAAKIDEAAKNVTSK